MKAFLALLLVVFAASAHVSQSESIDEPDTKSPASDLLDVREKYEVLNHTLVSLLSNMAQLLSSVSDKASADAAVVPFSGLTESWLKAFGELKLILNEYPTFLQLSESSDAADTAFSHALNTLEEVGFYESDELLDAVYRFFFQLTTAFRESSFPQEKGEDIRVPMPEQEFSLFISRRNALCMELCQILEEISDQSSADAAVAPLLANLQSQDQLAKEIDSQYAAPDPSILSKYLPDMLAQNERISDVCQRLKSASFYGSTTLRALLEDITREESDLISENAEGEEIKEDQ